MSFSRPIQWPDGTFSISDKVLNLLQRKANIKILYMSRLLLK